MSRIPSSRSGQCYRRRKQVLLQSSCPDSPPDHCSPPLTRQQWHHTLSVFAIAHGGPERCISGTVAAALPISHRCQPLRLGTTIIDPVMSAIPEHWAQPDSTMGLVYEIGWLLDGLRPIHCSVRLGSWFYYHHTNATTRRRIGATRWLTWQCPGPSSHIEASRCARSGVTSHAGSSLSLVSQWAYRSECRSFRRRRFWAHLPPLAQPFRTDSTYTATLAHRAQADRCGPTRVARATAHAAHNSKRSAQRPPQTDRDPPSSTTPATTGCQSIP